MMEFGVTHFEDKVNPSEFSLLRVFLVMPFLRFYLFGKGFFSLHRLGSWFRVRGHMVRARVKLLLEMFVVPA